MDPIGFAAGDVNLYRGVGNNAVKYLDPMGLDYTYQVGDQLYFKRTHYITAGIFWTKDWTVPIGTIKVINGKEYITRRDYIVTRSTVESAASDGQPYWKDYDVLLKWFKDNHVSTAGITKIGHLVPTYGQDALSEIGEMGKTIAYHIIEQELARVGIIAVISAGGKIYKYGEKIFRNRADAVKEFEKTTGKKFDPKVDYKSQGAEFDGPFDLPNSSGAIIYGKNADGHLAKHCKALLFNLSPQEAQKIIPQLKQALESLLRQADPSKTRIGQFHEYKNAVFYFSNGRMIITQSNGTFITVIETTSSNWFQKAVKP